MDNGRLFSLYQEILSTASPSSPVHDRHHPRWEQTQALLRQVQARLHMGPPGVLSPGELKTKYTQHRVTKVCAGCGRPELMSKTQKFCSLACKEQFNYRKRRTPTGPRSETSVPVSLAASKG